MHNGKPVIGLTCSWRSDETVEQHVLNESYLSAIRHFGGIPLMIPVFATEDEREFLLFQCDGLVLTGGNDLDPWHFGETVLNDSVVIAAERDREEFLDLRIAVHRDIPILGICRGIQVLNVFFGGSLYQDLPSQYPSEISHRMEKPFHRTCHRCLVEPGTPLHKLVESDCIDVNSHHHQAVKTIAPGFVVMACSDDGVIEAICDPNRKFCWGVQWHPERIWDIEKSSARLFRAFIDACRA